MARLSQAYVKTHDALSGGRTEEAAGIFGREFDPLAKALYAAMPRVYPPRFAKMENWCDWIKGLSDQSDATAASLRKGDAAQAAASLETLRVHFYNLHREAAQVNQSDLIYLFWRTAQKDNASAAALGQVVSLMERTPATARIQLDAGAFKKAKAAWLGAVEPILQDGKVESSELDALRKAAGAFYMQYGRDFE